MPKCRHLLANWHCHLCHLCKNICLFAFLQNCLQRCALLVVCEAATHALTAVLQLNQQKLLGRGEETFEQANQGTIEQHGETRKRVEVALWPSVQTKQIKGEKRGWEWVALWPENGESQHPSVWVYKPNQTNQTKKIKPNQTKPTYPKRPGTQGGKGGFVGKEWEKDPCVELTNQLHKPTQTKPNKTNQAKPNQTKQSPAKPCDNWTTGWRWLCGRSSVCRAARSLCPSDPDLLRHSLSIQPTTVVPPHCVVDYLLYLSIFVSLKTFPSIQWFSSILNHCVWVTLTC